MSTILPQELIDSVIDHCHDSRPTLKTCAVICKAWLSPSRSHLFHTITLHPPPKPKRKAVVKRITDAQRLFRMLQFSPQIVPYIRDLSICEGMAGREWIAQEKTLPVLLSTFKNIQSFKFEREASMQISWMDLPTDVQDALAGILASPTLLELSLVGLVFDSPVDLHWMLKACKTLRVLQVNHLLLRDGSSELLLPGIRERQQRAPLDILEVGPRTSTALIDSLLHPESTINVSSVRKLSMAVSGHFADFAKLLRSMSSIESLEIILMNDSA